MELPENKLSEFIKGDGKAKWLPINNHNIKNFTEDEITRITNNYSTPIGKGAFGEVYRGALDDGCLVAVKILKKYVSPDLKEGFAKELTVHCQINHKNVVRLLGYCLEGNSLMMVTEYISRGNLREVLHGSDDPISLDARLGIAIDCAEALSYMHSSMYQPIIHGDIKPDNILLDGNLGAKLSDFGISRLLSSDETQYTINVAGSRGYMDPEHIASGLVDPKNDVYSFGVVLLELVTREKASKNGINTGLAKKFAQALEKGKKIREMFDTEIANVSNVKVLDQAGKLVAECLREDFKKRPEMRDVAERLRVLRNLHCQQGQEKTGQWSLWRPQDTTQKVNRQGTSISISNSYLSYKLNNLGIFNRDSRKNCMTNADHILEKTNNLTIFTKAELEKITRNYSEPLGYQVYKGMLPNCTTVQVTSCIFTGTDTLEEFKNLMEIPRIMIHKNILKLYGCCLEAKPAFLVYEFTAGGSLQDILHGSHHISLQLDLRLDIAIGAAGGLAYMHSSTTCTIKHGDVKPENILLDDKYMPKISHFSLLKVLQADQDYKDHYVIGDMAYMDPVYRKTGLLSVKSDVYSFGVVLLELITRRPAIYNESSSFINDFLNVYKQANSGRALFDKNIATEENISILEEIGRLALLCLKEEQKERPEMREVAERLAMIRKGHYQQGQEKICPWSLCRGYDTTQKFNQQRASMSRMNVFPGGSVKSFMKNSGSVLVKINNLMIFTKNELTKITNNYSKFLGAGSFSKTYKGFLESGILVAVKVYINFNDNAREEIINELEIQTHMIHKNILMLFGCCIEADVPVFVYELAARGSLHDILHSSHHISLPLDLRLDIAIEAAEGLTYMHSSTTRTIRHGDVKPDNILLDDNYVPKISGFWLSSFLQGDQDYLELVRGTMNYIDPVFQETGRLSLKSDVYSFGVVLLEFITRKQVKYNESDNLINKFRKVYEQDNSGRALFDEEVATEEDALILEEIGRLAVFCLAEEMEERPEMKEVAERLVAIRRARRSGETNYMSSHQSEEISTDGECSAAEIS